MEVVSTGFVPMEKQHPSGKKRDSSEIAFWGKSSPEDLDRQADGHSAVPADLQAQLTLV